MEIEKKEYIASQLRLNHLLDEVKAARRDVEKKRIAYMEAYLRDVAPEKIAASQKGKKEHKEHKTVVDKFSTSSLPRP